MFDFHTHNLMAKKALISVEPGFTPLEGALYSVGIHPWHSADVTREKLQRLEADARLDCVKAIGETGLDKLRGGAAEAQIELLKHHIELSETLGKPLVLHVVKAFPEIIVLKRRMQPVQPWIIHGFRGKRQLAEELLRHGFYLSLGENFNAEAARIIPSNRLLAETDESTANIAAIAGRHLQLDPALAVRLLKLND